jgi:hypothetical protein
MPARTSRKAAGLAAVVAMALAAATAPAARAAVPDPPLRDADYFEFADQVTRHVERDWSTRLQMYDPSGRSVQSLINAAMLTVFATSAAHGHIGPARNDERARTLARLLVREPPYWTGRTAPKDDKMFHTPGWTSNIVGPYFDMDKSIDPKVAEGLQIAWRARDILGLDPETVRLIPQRVRAVAYTPFFRYPLVRLNQINWNSELYAYDWMLTGDPTLLRQDYREHVRRFVRGIRHPLTPGGSTNLGPSYRFQYQVNQARDNIRNLDSAEYSNMTLHFLYWYPEALQAGMQPLPRADMRLLRGWVQRDLFGYWTHAGFMNWDTGWSYARWMKAKSWAYGQQALFAIARSHRFDRDPRYASWAKYIFDRGLQLYVHLGGQAGNRPYRPRPDMWGIRVSGNAQFFWARMAANAARAVSAGLGHMAARQPPPFYAFDADIGRLAVSTPRYSTGLLAVNRVRVPYGGQELARLYDADGDPIAGTGGKPPMSFGVLVNAPGGRRVLATQTGLHQDPRRPPLVLERSPRGRVTRQKRLPTKLDAGPFGRLAVAGTRSAGGVSVTSRWSFHASSIDGSWSIRRPAGRGADDVRVLFPSWGTRSVVEAIMRDGREITLAAPGAPRRSVALAGVAAFRIRARYGSYRVVLRGRPTGTTTIIAGRWQKPNPQAGPTLALRLPALRRGQRRLGVTLVPAGAGGTGEGEKTPASSSPSAG